jgi:NAD(P)-dependent dehydrogenase (short-subunit alcohol dehydrogenase family)
MNKYQPTISGHALVLGGSGGIGSEIVKALVANGIQTISFTYGRNKAAADRLVEELTTQGVKTYTAPIDQSDEQSVNNFLEEAVVHMGEEISVAINAIGISPNTPLEEQTIEEWREVFEINLFGCFSSTRAIANRMRAKGTEGSITLITSTNGVNSHSQISLHYDCSKAAQILMMRGIAEYYATNKIRTNGVAPGWINTKMNDTLPADERAKEMAKIWTGRFAEPHEIATVVVTLAGTTGSYIWGQNIMVDGGYR